MPLVGGVDPNGEKYASAAPGAPPPNPGETQQQYYVRTHPNPESLGDLPAQVARNPNYQDPQGDIGVGAIWDPAGAFVGDQLLGGAEQKANEQAAAGLKSLSGEQFDAINDVGDKAQGYLEPWRATGAAIAANELMTPGAQEKLGAEGTPGLDALSGAATAEGMAPGAREKLAATGSGMLQGVSEGAVSQTGGPGYAERLFQSREGGALDGTSLRALEVGQRKIGDAGAAFGNTRGGATMEAIGNLTTDVVNDQNRRQDALAALADTGMNTRLRTGLAAADTNESTLTQRAGAADAGTWDRLTGASNIANDRFATKSNIAEGSDVGRMNRKTLAMNALGDPAKVSAGLATETGLAANQAKTDLAVAALGGDIKARTARSDATKDLFKAGLTYLGTRK